MDLAYASYLTVLADALRSDAVNSRAGHAALRLELAWDCCGLKAGTELLHILLMNDKFFRVRIHFQIMEDGSIISMKTMVPKLYPMLDCEAVQFDKVLELLESFGYLKYRIGGI